MQESVFPGRKGLKRETPRHSAVKHKSQRNDMNVKTTISCVNIKKVT